MEIKYSIIICTYNRSNLLNRSIPSVLNQITDNYEFELIIIDNASNDNTKKITSMWESNDSRVKYVYEPKQGLSIARNRGLHVALGQFIIYIDDDAEALTGWIRAIDRGFCNPANPVSVCGPVHLRWPEKKPFWVSQKHETLFTCLDHGESSFLFSRSEHFLVGTNMAFNRRVLIEIGGFNENLGRAGDNLLSGEESELIEQIKRKGFRIFYSPKAAVLHHVTSERLSLKWYVNRVFMDGVSQKRLKSISSFDNSKSQLLAFEFKTLVNFILKFGFNVLSFQKENSKLYFGEILQRCGRLFSTFKNL